jgi:hypothetical protein
VVAPWCCPVLLWMRLHSRGGCEGQQAWWRHVTQAEQHWIPQVTHLQLLLHLHHPCSLSCCASWLSREGVLWCVLQTRLCLRDKRTAPSD